MCLSNLYQNISSALSGLSFFQQFLLCILGIVVFFAFRFIVDYFKRSYLTHWWDRSRKTPNGPPESWDAVKYIMDHEPLESEPFCMRIRFLGCKWLRDFIFVVLGYFTFYALFNLVWSQDLNVECLKAANVEYLKIAAGFSAFLTFVGVLYSGKVSTRSVNRQKWIDELRSLLSEAVHSHPDYHPKPYKVALKEDCEALKKEIKASQKLARLETVQEKNERLDRLFAKIELMLNPAERDHRALMALLRFFYGVDFVEIDKVVLKELNLEGKKADALEHDEFIKVKSQMIRLMNAILKREWEQVKWVR